MDTMRFDDILVTPLSIFETKGGNVMHAMRDGDRGYVSYGESYFSWVDSGSIKAWKYHSKMVMNLIVPIGLVRFVFHLENNEKSPSFFQLDIGEKNYVRVTVPPRIWFGFQGLGVKPSLVLNIGSVPHDPDEVHRKLLHEFPFDWNAKT